MRCEYGPSTIKHAYCVTLCCVSQIIPLTECHYAECRYGLCHDALTHVCIISTVLLGRKRGAEQERVSRADAPVSPRAQIGAVPLEDLVRVRHVRGRVLMVSNSIKLFFLRKLRVFVTS
jgi:hypothetical protein